MAEVLQNAEDLAISLFDGVAAAAVAAIFCLVCASVSDEFKYARCVTLGDLLYAIFQGAWFGIMLILFLLREFATLAYRRVIHPILEIEIYRPRLTAISGVSSIGHRACHR